jgi:hypothetical protein
LERTGQVSSENTWFCSLKHIIKLFSSSFTNLSRIRRLGKEPTTIIDNIIFMVIQFRKRPIPHTKWQAIVYKNRFNALSWNIAWIDHQVLTDLVLKSSLEI